MNRWVCCNETHNRPRDSLSYFIVGNCRKPGKDPWNFKHIDNYFSKHREGIEKEFNNQEIFNVVTNQEACGELLPRRDG